MTPEKEQKLIKDVSTVGIGGNILLVLFKFYAGIAGHSAAMVSDAIHSLSDVAATLIAFIGIKISKKEADDNHPYGHDRFECLASMILGIILAVTGIMIGIEGVKNVIAIAHGDFEGVSIPSTIALIAAIVSIVVKELMFQYTMRIAKKLNSPVFKADAWHHRSDALSSIGSLIGIGGAMLGYVIFEPLASIAICLCILKVAYDVLKEAISNVLDTAAEPEFVEEARGFIASQEGVLDIDSFHTRRFGSKLYIDAEIGVDAHLSLVDAHEIAQRVHDAVEKQYPDVKHIMIHENPVHLKGCPCEQTDDAV